MSDYDLIPEATLDALEAYRDHRRDVGHFLTAVLENDLRKACHRADAGNARALVQIVTWCYNRLPAAAWGSRERVLAWLDHADVEV